MGQRAWSKDAFMTNEYRWGWDTNTNNQSQIYFKHIEDATLFKLIWLN